MPDFPLLVLAGIGGGLTGSIAGLASLVSYPALLAAGLSPVAANVTNTVALIFNTVGSVSASRPELTGQRPRLLRLGVSAVLGGAVGAVLLLVTPAGSFERVVPVLILFASAAVLIPRPAAHPDRLRTDPIWLAPVVFAVGIYGGYFGAAAGVLLLASLLLATPESLPQANAMKSALLGTANAVAAVGFVFFGHVVWSAALPLAIGLFIGGSLGPRIVRRSPPTPLRLVISFAGVGLAVKLGLNAYT
ncbi:sulfite exporter TauE/SafE family protein [Jatrophihabitans telluris]|uniref:Probable membrane transporter protein n=1 Tax=Jatrophihabitans telluris TaxID=2038343 RepID=A0ABY4R635_9ACTN|nr:sulfite exporter TauE/SafE family protein [Jatrophihabitans telluris]UQX90357.1 sulfite exporter TauE/SafE family protein [Jatrophihabitans telluris]